MSAFLAVHSTLQTMCALFGETSVRGIARVGGEEPEAGRIFVGHNLDPLDHQTGVAPEHHHLADAGVRQATSTSRRPPSRSWGSIKSPYTQRIRKSYGRALPSWRSMTLSRYPAGLLDCGFLAEDAVIGYAESEHAEEWRAERIEWGKAIPVRRRFPLRNSPVAKRLGVAAKQCTEFPCQLQKISTHTCVHCTKYRVSRPKQRVAQVHCQ